MGTWEMDVEGKKRCPRKELEKREREVKELWRETMAAIFGVAATLVRVEFLSDYNLFFCVGLWWWTILSLYCTPYLCCKMWIEWILL